MATRIAIASPKGGAGKTTVSLNLALAFAEKGRRTLLVDLDPQGGIGHSLGRGDAQLGGLAELILETTDAPSAVMRTKLPTLSLLPRGRLRAIDVPAFEDALRTPGVLEGALLDTETGIDLVILDTPSGLGMPTRAALAVASHVLVPLQAEPLALRSMGQILEVIEHVRENENPGLQLLGILPTMVAREKTASLDVLLTVWNDFGAVLETSIPRSDVFLDASAKGLPVGFLAGAPSPEARRFDLLADEIESILMRLGAREKPGVTRAERQLL